MHKISHGIAFNITYLKAKSLAIYYDVNKLFQFKMYQFMKYIIKDTK